MTRCPTCGRPPDRLADSEQDGCCYEEGDWECWMNRSLALSAKLEAAERVVDAAN
jgi:hypothetical protein